MNRLVSYAAGRFSRVPSRVWHRCYSASLPEGWERITRRNGEVVYYNAALRKTVRDLPGVPREAPSPPIPEQPSANTTDKETGKMTLSESQTVPHNEAPEDEVFVPIDFDTATTIDGHESQVIHVELGPQQCLRAETGAMIFMSDGVEMETTSAGGFQQGMKRMMTGETFFVSRFTYTGTSKGTVALGTSFPSKILRLRLAEFIGHSIICQKGAFLCGSDTINIEMEFAKNFGAGFFGGEGFILQRLTGSGDAFVRASGALIERDLQPGEVLRISSGCLVAFEPSVHYDIMMMKGVKNVVFGGEGLFVTTLTGPGKIYLQSLPFDRVVGEIAARVPRAGGPGMMFPFFAGGGGGEGGATNGAADEAAAAGENAAGVAPSEDTSTWNSSPEGDASIYGAADASPTKPDSAFDDFGEPGEVPEAEGAGKTVVDFFKSIFGSD